MTTQASEIVATPTGYDSVTITIGQAGVPEWQWKIDFAEGFESTVLESIPCSDGYNTIVGTPGPLIIVDGNPVTPQVYYTKAGEQVTFEISGLLPGGNVTLYARGFTQTEGFMARVNCFSLPIVPQTIFTSSITATTARVLFDYYNPPGASRSLSDGYNVYSFDPNTGYTLLNSTPIPSTQEFEFEGIDIAGLNPGTNYLFSITRVIGNAESPKSPTFSVFTQDALLVMIEQSSTGPNEINFSWAPPEGHTAPAQWNYRIAGHDGHLFGSTVDQSTHQTSTPSVSFEDVVYPGGMITLQVWAGLSDMVPETETSPYEGYASGYSIPPEAVPVNVTGVTQTTATLTLQKVYPIEINFTAIRHVEYDLYQNGVLLRSNLPYTEYMAIDTFTVLGLTPGTEYQNMTIKVHDVTTGYESNNPSAKFTFTTQTGTAIDPPTNFAVSDCTTNQATFSWTNVPGAESYTIYGLDSVKPNAVNGGAITLTPDIEYLDVYVTAVIGGEGSPDSNHISVYLTPRTNDTLPITVTANSTTTTGITFSWTDPTSYTGATHWFYQIQLPLSSNINVTDETLLTYYTEDLTCPLFSTIRGLILEQPGNSSIALKIWTTTDTAEHNDICTGTLVAYNAPDAVQFPQVVDTTATTATLRWAYGYGEYYQILQGGNVPLWAPNDIPAANVTRINEITFLPDPEGTLEQYTITGLSPETTYGNIQIRRISHNLSNASFAPPILFVTLAGSSAPMIANIAPTSGSTLGQIPFMISGENFEAPLQVLFGETEATEVFDVSDVSISGITPPHDAGTVDISVILEDMRIAVLPSAFNYYVVQEELPITITSIAPTSGSTLGQIPFTIYGENFEAPLQVLFGETEATGVLDISATAISGITPPHGVGPVDITVTLEDTRTATLSGAFNYYYDEPAVVPPVLDEPSLASITSTTVQLTWSSSLPAADSYTVYFGDIPQYNAISGSTFTLAEGGFFQNVRVAAVLEGQEYFSNAINVRLLPATPDKPQIMPVAGSPEQAEFDVTWAIPSGASTYDIYILGEGHPATLCGQDLTQNSTRIDTRWLTDPVLPPNTPFEVIIQAKNATGISGNSEHALAYTAPTAPAADISINSITANGFQVNWESGNTAAKFEIRLEGTLLQQVDRGSNSATITSMASNVQIQNVLVIAIGDGAITGLGYQPLSATTILSPNVYTLAAKPTLPTQPLTELTHNSVTINWLSDNTKKFHVFNNGSFVEEVYLPANETDFSYSFTPGTLTPNTQQNISIKSININGAVNHDSRSIPAFYTLAESPTASILPGSVTTNAAIITWNDTAVAYHVYVGALNLTAGNPTNANSYQLESLTPNTRYTGGYEVRVVALNNDMIPNQMSATVAPFCTLAEQPTFVTPIPAANGVLIKWAAPAGSTVSEYKLFAPGDPVGIALASSTIEYSVAMGENTTGITVIKSVNLDGVINETNPLQITATTLAGIPTLVAIGSVGTSNATISWSPSSATSVNIYNPEGQPVLGGQQYTGTSLVVAGLQPNQEYGSYIVKSVNRIGVENPTGVTAAPFQTKPNRPNGLERRTDIGDPVQVFIRWNTPVGGADSYKIKVDNVERPDLTITEV